ncbi:carbonic anhydrase [Chitinophaga sp. SYP-B3965]|uniref:carbonic anhydrase n=1 Tax=Chitinophaga sp. SYP-B3965 TaxID=2663120 RepID=UPI0012996D21|nr:carbonic anhydrase [Chitinophaga sp. SYP-B3965]MRG45683.1 carbonic anhydrase [Chitinophaga sp. SYP-B3965]
MDVFEQLLANNKVWAAKKVAEDKDFFKRLQNQQAPKFLWIGCSDSRVPANEITNTEPGEIFVHRNVANMVVHTDMNLLTVLEYAVKILKVEHVLVVGHYGCGGVKAAMTNQNFGIINPWLKHIKDVYRLHRDEIDALDSEDKQVDRLIELNVQEQVMNLAKTITIQEAWAKEQRPHLHGWVYGLKDGLINPVFDMAPGTHIDPIYEFDV